LVVSNSLLFRYADFIRHLGGTDTHLGVIVGLGTVGGLAMRWWQCHGIDRYGSARIWMWSNVAMLLSMVGHLTLVSLEPSWLSSGQMLFIAGLLRGMFWVTIAGVFGGSLTYISQTVPPARIAEIVGALGSSGFLGLFLGPELGDRIFRGGQSGAEPLKNMFLANIALVGAALVCTILATRGDRRPRPHRRSSLVGLVRLYNPGWILLVGAAFGWAISIPGTFLRTFTEELGIDEIRLFFQVYAVTAFVVRLLTRRFPERVGLKNMIAIGVVALTASLISYLAVDGYYMLILPALLAGFAHALLFPAVVSAGCSAFPARHRGLGTSLILGSFDLGMLVGAPLVGVILDHAPSIGLSAYPTMFVVVAAVLGTFSLPYFLRPVRKPATPQPRARKTPKPQPVEVG
jgi:MFS family permease